MTDMEVNVTERFHIILFYTGDIELLEKNYQQVKKQYQKNHITHIIFENSLNEKFYSESERYISTGEWVVHPVNESAIYNVSLLGDVMKAIKEGWICFMKPNDEWMPYHLTAMKDAIVQCSDRKFFYTLNTNGSLKEIKEPCFDINRIDFTNLNFSHHISLSQMMVHHSIVNNVFLPGLRIEPHTDLMVMLAFINSCPLQRVNRFTCSCRTIHYSYNRNHLDSFILTVSVAVRNLISDNTHRVGLMSKAYRRSVWLLLRRMKLIYSVILLSEMLCHMSGLSKGVKGRMIHVD